MRAFRKNKRELSEKKRASRKKINKKTLLESICLQIDNTRADEAKSLGSCGSVASPDYLDYEKTSPENFTAVHYPAYCRLRRHSRA
jgi:hypothetical protein